MALFRYTQTLLSVAQATGQNQTGKTYAVPPTDGDRMEDSQLSWMAFLDVTQAGGATSPTTDVTVETSHDGVNWVSVCTATQLTADGAEHEFKAISALGPLVRARTTLGGGTKPNHTAVVKLACDGSFRLKEK